MNQLITVLLIEKIYNDTEEIIKKLKINIDPKVKLRYLSVAQKQMVEIAKCVSQESKVIIFDEPTYSLTDKEISTLFALIRNLKAHGVGIIYISHRLEEIKQIGDRVTILRDGHFIETRRSNYFYRNDDKFNGWTRLKI